MCTLEYITDFTKSGVFIDHMSQVMQLDDIEAFIHGMDEQTVLQYLLGMAAYASLELALGVEAVEILFTPLKVADMKQFVVVLAEHARTFM